MKLTAEHIEKIKNREITEAILTDGSKVRIFYGTFGFLCRYKPKSRKYGYRLEEFFIDSLVIKKSSTKTPDELTYKVISKFRKEALKATFTNDFIRDCVNLPKSFDEWVNDGKKSPYQYGITTGCKITGQLVSIKSICGKLNSNYHDMIKNAIKDKKDFVTGRFNYNGYDGSLTLSVDANGEFRGYFAKEFKNCGNGYYYLLINDDYFIGYDID
jgi:hypothetical protein